MKKFVYQVKEFKFEDSAAFGTAWAQAKSKAMELHAPIFREIITDNKVKKQVYYTGGLFNSIEFMKEDNVKIF